MIPRYDGAYQGWLCYDDPSESECEKLNTLDNP